MKIIIKGNKVTFEDGMGNVLCMTTEQLIDIVKLLNLSIRPEGDFRFNCLEFTV